MKLSELYTVTVEGENPGDLDNEIHKAITEIVERGTTKKQYAELHSIQFSHAPVRPDRYSVLITFRWVPGGHARLVSSRG